MQRLADIARELLQEAPVQTIAGADARHDLRRGPTHLTGDHLSRITRCRLDQHKIQNHHGQQEAGGVDNVAGNAGGDGGGAPRLAPMAHGLAPARPCDLIEGRQRAPDRQRKVDQTFVEGCLVRRQVDVGDRHVGDDDLLKLAVERLAFMHVHLDRSVSE